jgi:hypothetical protein
MSGKVFTDFDVFLMAVRCLLQGGLSADARIKIAAKSLQMLNHIGKIVTEDFFDRYGCRVNQSILSSSS